MIQSIQDYENWRDRQYDLPEPDSTTPDEHATYAYSHDYPADTKLDYVRDGEHAELRLSFTWEDPDTDVYKRQPMGFTPCAVMSARTMRVPVISCSLKRPWEPMSRAVSYTHLNI